MSQQDLSSSVDTRLTIDKNQESQSTCSPARPSSLIDINTADGVIGRINCMTDAVLEQTATIQSNIMKAHLDQPNTKVTSISGLNTTGDSCTSNQQLFSVESNTTRPPVDDMRVDMSTSALTTDTKTSCQTSKDSAMTSSTGVTKNSSTTTDSMYSVEASQFKVQKHTRRDFSPDLITAHSPTSLSENKRQGNKCQSFSQLT